MTPKDGALGSFPSTLAPAPGHPATQGAPGMDSALSSPAEVQCRTFIPVNRTDELVCSLAEETVTRKGLPGWSWMRYEGAVGPSQLR